MTTFKEPVLIGVNTGAPTTDTRITSGGLKVVELSAGGKTLTRAVPDNCTLFDLNVVASAIPAAVTQGLTVRIGTAASPTLYGQINAVVNGFTRGTVNTYGAAVTGSVVFDVTSSVAASAADFNAGGLRIRLLLAPQG